MSDLLAYICCPGCRHQAQEVIYASINQRRGWFCKCCGMFEPAIGRERLLETKEKSDDNK